MTTDNEQILDDRAVEAAEKTLGLRDDYRDPEHYDRDFAEEFKKQREVPAALSDAPDSNTTLRSPAPPVTLRRRFSHGGFELTDGTKTVYIGVLKSFDEDPDAAEAAWISDHWQTALAADMDLPYPLSAFRSQRLYEFGASTPCGHTVALFDRREGAWLCGSVDCDSNFSRLCPPKKYPSRAEAIAAIPGQHAKWSGAMYAMRHHHD